MALILDAGNLRRGALSGFVDGDPAIRTALGNELELALPAIVLGEYLFGIRQSRYRIRYEGWLSAHLQAFLPLPSGFSTAEAYADIRFELKSTGTPIPTNHLWIAALAREYGFRLATRDSHFNFVRGLRIIPW